MGHDLKNMTAGGALELAFAISGKHRRDVAEELGLGYEVIQRYLNPTDNYQPPLRHIPALCRVLGNTILLDWQAAQLEDFKPCEGVKTLQGLFRGVNALSCEVGDVHRAAKDAISDSVITPSEASEIAGEVADVERVARTLREQLQPIAGHVVCGGKMIKVLLVDEEA